MYRYLFGVGFVFLLFATTASAATLYIDPNSATLKQGDAIAIAIRLDTDELAGECVNAVDGVLSYDSAIDPVDISIGKSIFPVWVEAPVINKEAHTITFAGGIPNGYCGRVQGDPNLTNTLVELIFRAPVDTGILEEKTASVTFMPETTAYLNDGLGTKAQLRTFGSTITLSRERTTATGDVWTDAISADKQPPEDFSVQLSTWPTGEYYIIFSTTDKQTGISHYEVLEESNAEAKLFHFGAVNAPWIKTAGPAYTLKDQTLRSVIRVKAVDKAGNEYLTTFVPDKSLQKSFFSMTVLFIIGGVLLVFSLGILFWWMHRERRNKNLITNQTNQTSL